MAPAAASPPPAAAGELFKDNKRNAAFIRAFLGLPAAPEAVRIFDRREYYTVRARARRWRLGCLAHIAGAWAPGPRHP